MTTKEKILDAALTLFAERGYDGTSVEQIARLVGIKAPSLYKHFKGKEDILNTLVDIAEVRYEEKFGSSNNLGKIPETLEEFVRMTMKRIRFTMTDPVIRRIRIFLVQEQFRSPALSEITTRHQLDGLHSMYMKIIKKMMESGLLKENDPAMLALELASPAVVLVAKADRQPESEKECLKYIENHLWHFCDIYGFKG